MEFNRVLVMQNIIGYELHTPIKVFLNGDWQSLIGEASPYVEGNKLIVDMECKIDVSGLYPALMCMGKSVKGIMVSANPNEDDTIPSIPFITK